MQVLLPAQNAFSIDGDKCCVQDVVMLFEQCREGNRLLHLVVHLHYRDLSRPLSIRGSIWSHYVLLQCTP